MDGGEKPDSVAALAVRPAAVPDDAAPAVASLRAASRSGHVWLLDSALRSERLGRFSFAGIDPYAVLRCRGRRTRLDVLRPVRPELGTGSLHLDADPLERARELMPRLAPGAAAGLPFVGGAVGWLGYELAAQLERGLFGGRGGFRGRDELDLPDLLLMFVDRVLAFDHQAGRVFACGLGFGPHAGAAAERAAQELEQALGAGAGRDRGIRSPGRRAPQDADAAAYAKSVDAILEEIAAGNVYQACLTTRFERAFSGDPWSLYEGLRTRSPAPFASFLELPEVCVAGASPERFLRVTPGGQVESRPIKGTRPRAQDPAQDAAQRLALERSAKDRAENLMIVDLVRNDLGRVCRTGSVDVPELMAVEAYAQVFQMVSTVTGRLREDRDAFDAIRASFPPGSMTGAPKIAAMRLLDRLEPLRRGVYSGAIGYLDARGGADLSVVIRTALLKDGRAHVHAGGGIVADSEPGAEWQEALEKAAPLLAALEEEGS